MPHNVYLLLGSNEGDRRGNLNKSSDLISQRAGDLLKVSSLYETAPWGKTDQSVFLNQAVSIGANLDPELLLGILKSIEREAGRVNREKWGPRVIDIDILLYGTKVIQQPALQVPHPYLPVRRFALAPLAEIAGDIVHPVLQKTIRELLEACPDKSEVKPV